MWSCWFRPFAKSWHRLIFEQQLIPGRLLRRYKRFLADIELDSGEQITALTPNTGSMKGVCVPGERVMVSCHDSPTRKLKYTWEMIHLEGDWVGINTHLTNKIAGEALRSGMIPAFRKYKEVRAEVKIADDTRIDFVLGSDTRCLVEVKNVTLVENRMARFPDSVTTRGTKHLNHLIHAVENGEQAAMLYVCQHHAGAQFEPADDIDPVYGDTLRQAYLAGVKIEAWVARVTPTEITLTHSIPVSL
ncbi:DNA/RNA nuclease SfsA [bacterium]|nr:DNA/RNA nuclease SfsA [bacterium]